MRIALILLAVASVIAALGVAGFGFASAAFCSDANSAESRSNCFKEFLMSPLVAGLALLSIAFLASAVGILRRRNWARYLGVLAWLTSTAVYAYGIKSLGEPINPFQLVTLASGVLAAAFLLLPPTGRQFRR